MRNQKPSFRFEIDNFSEKEVAIPSRSGGCEWYLNLHPKGDNLCDDHLSLYLCVANPKSLGRHTIFREKSLAWGFRKTLPLSKFEEKGFLENDILIIEVYIDIIEAFDGVGEDESEKKETIDINGFQVLASQVTLVRKIFAEHPDLAEDLKPKNQVVKTTYMNILLTLIEKLHDKPSQNHSETELSNAHRQLSELLEMGFKLDWLKSKLDEVSLERKKSDDADGSWVQQLEERVKNLELMELDFKLDSLKTKLDEVSLEKKKADADWSRVQQLEETVKNLAIMVSDLKVELEKEKAKSCADGFLLVKEDS